ncbi:MAG: DUF2937 family protein [Wenzhouxiangellaceae bacterium]|nr:DUF2937 family protein [Wenzhouxiangellaceae bacterium]
MSWLSRRLDHFGSASFGAFGGLGFSQAPAFTQAYLQRLGGHIDEARLTIERVADGRILPWLAEDAREQAIAELSLRLHELERLAQVLIEAPAMLRPVLLVRHADWSIARRAADSFTPTVPVDPASLAWIAIGILLSVLVYESCKLPFWASKRRRAAGPAAAPEPEAARKADKKHAGKKTAKKTAAKKQPDRLPGS